MITEVKNIFKENEEPCVRRFNENLALLPLSQHEALIRGVYRRGLGEWMQMNQQYRYFTLCFIRSNWQFFLEHLRTQTVFSQLRYPLREPALVTRLIDLSEGDLPRRSSTQVHLNFSLLHAFDLGREYKIDSLSKYVKRHPLKSEELISFYGRIPLCNEEDEL